jgi:RND family efflux transporter MFP subunit
MRAPKVSRRAVWIAVGATAALVAAAAWSFRHAPAVEVVRVAEGTLEETVRGPAQIQARVPVTLSARLTAAVIAMVVDVGDGVRQGQVLVRLDDREVLARVAAASAALARAKADLALADSNERRDREVFERGYISPAAMEATASLRSAREAEVAAAEQELHYAETLASHALLMAPMDGVVVARLAEVGDIVAPGTPILRLVDPGTLQAVARIDETVSGRIEPGMPAVIRLRAGGEARGKVARIGLEADAAARELEVEVAFDEPPARFAIDQEAEVAIRVGDARGLVVPLSAVTRLDGRPGVLVVRAGRAVFQPIETGAIGDGRLIAREGLASGDLVVREALSVRAGARVRTSGGE